MGERQAIALQNFESMSLILSQALGGTKSDSGDNARPIQSAAEAEAAFKSVFRR